MSSNSTSPHSGGNLTHPGGNYTHHGNSTGAGGWSTHGAAARLAMHHQNLMTMKYYAAALTGIIVLFTIFHWTRFLYSRYAPKSVRRSGIMKSQVSIARLVRHVLTHRVPGFTSIGHAVLVTIYITINIVLTVTHIPWTSSMPISQRLGWMAIANVAFVTFLALKNTPLAFLTSYSYESLNPLHQVAGYTTVIFAILHGIMMGTTFKRMHEKMVILSIHQIHGMIAVVAMFVAVLFAILIKRVRYEVFYIVHIVMYMVAIINIAFHRPDLADKTIIITFVAAAMWGSDRIFRGLRILWYSYDNRAIITPLPHGGTRILLERSPSRAVPGAHCFLWIPKIRAFETHPFTIVTHSLYSIEMVISAYDGFTNDLHEYAVKHPGATLRASFDGPYGAPPSFAKSADKIILIAGGSGASFTFGIAIDLIKKLRDAPKPTIDFIWSVKEQEQFSWFDKELARLRDSSRVNVILHTTSPTGPMYTPDSPIVPNSPTDEEKRTTLQDASPIEHSTTNLDRFPADVEKPALPHSTTPNAWDSSVSLNVLPGRPDIANIVKNIISTSGADERIAVAACGPDSLMWAVRRTVASNITVKGPSIELHCEQFGW